MKQWYISQMVCISEDSDLKDFVINVNWNRNAKKTINNKEYFSSVYGSQLFSKNDITNFIPYEDLTYEIVCGWLDSIIDTNALDLTLDAQIQNQVKPPIVILPLPFENPIN